MRLPNPRYRLLMRASATVAVMAGVMVFASACQLDEECSNCEDIVAEIPWETPQTYTYELQRGDERVGDYVLSVEEGEGETLELVQRYEGDEGDSDVATVTVEAETLKPLHTLRIVQGEDERRVAEANYEEVPEGECDDGVVARIEQRVYSPPDAEEPDSTRRNPLCIPEHSYENDSSLFLWRTIPFEEGYEATYNAVLTAVRDIQQITIRVEERVDNTPVGAIDAWRVIVESDGRTQQAWFAVEGDHRLLAYQNGDLTFLLQE
jgi:hypothetical protein